MKRRSTDKPLELFGPLYVAAVNSPIGKLWLESDGERILRVSFENIGRGKSEQPKVLKEAVKQVEQYFKGKRRIFELPLANVGSPFRKHVWKQISAVKFGRVLSYNEIAAKVGGNARAVGGACGANPLPIIVPCHRVMSSSGMLTGYIGGIWRKRWLLEHEGVFPKELFNKA